MDRAAPTDNRNVLRGIGSFVRSRRKPAVVAALAGASLSGAITAIAVTSGSRSTTIVALLFVLVVLASSSLGGYGAGVAVSLVCFLSLNFFFTTPLRTFEVSNGTDVVALLVFLTVSVGVGLLLSAAVRERAEAQRRGRELRLINRLTTALLSGEPLELVLPRFGNEINQTLGSSRCVISTPDGTEIELGERSEIELGRAREIPLRVRGHSVGRLLMWPTSREWRPPPQEAEIAEAFARQLALAFEGVRLRDDIKRAEIESESNRLKASLFSGVTHDVKTPLATIKASVTSLLEGSGFSESQRREHLEMIQQETERLHRVVNNLLDLARLRAGAIQPAKSPSPIDEVIDSVVARLRPQLADHDVIVRVNDDLPDVPMDVVQIDQVLTNLVENAAKFSPPGEEIVVAASGDSTRVRISVVDAGRGVAKGQELAIFEPFHHGTHDGAGTGLGLAIAKAIVTAHGGAIWVSRTPRGGSSFAFDLPVAEPEGVDD